MKMVAFKWMTFHFTKRLILFSKNYNERDTRVEVAVSWSLLEDPFKFSRFDNQGHAKQNE